MLYLLFFYTEKVAQYFDSLLKDKEHYDIAKEVRRTMQSYCYVLSRINHASEAIGKDGRFQIFICIGVRFVFISQNQYLLSYISLQSKKSNIYLYLHYYNN